MRFGRILLLGSFFFYLQGESAFPAEVLREATTVTCSQGRSARVQLRSTDRLPDATGVAKVERQGGITTVAAELDGLKPATLFGGDYNTYVLWVVSPDGRIINLGEFMLDGTRSQLQATTNLSTFAIFVTAEPHYLVTIPSAFVVLENEAGKHGSTIRHPILQGIYNFERGSLEDVKEARGKVHTEVKQAFTAVRLAQRARADVLAKDELSQAEHALDETLRLFRHRADQNEITAQARETVRLAVAAQTLAEDRALLGARVVAEGSGGGNAESPGRGPRGIQQ